MSMNKRKNIGGVVFIAAGILMILAALLLTAYNIWDEQRALREAESVIEQIVPEQEQAIAQSNSLSEKAVVIPDYILNPEMEMPQVEIDDQNYIGILSIPALGVELPVMNEWSYPRLKIAPCRYSGSVYQDRMIIAGHNYQSHFGGLKHLQPGDRISFMDMDGNLFQYSVAELEVLEKSDVERMEEGDWELTLFTCTIGGEQRVTVRCVK